MQGVSKRTCMRYCGAKAEACSVTNLRVLEPDYVHRRALVRPG